jgi:hypothetical protein
MALQDASKQTAPPPSVVATGPGTPWARPLALTAALMFLLSSVFPVVAAFVTDTEAWPKWWGVLDVGIAFVLAALALAVLAIGQKRVDRPAEDASYRAYRVLLHGIFGMLLVFVFLGDRIIWSQCLTGIAWRAWLLLYCLPSWFALWAAKESPLGRPP